MSTTVTVQTPTIEDLPKRAPHFKFSLDVLKRPFKDKTPVRPSPEIAHTWALSFKTLMKSTYGKLLFRAFLTQEFSEENVDFWLAVEKYKTCKKRRLIVEAKKIFTNFVIAEAPMEVNLDSTMKRSLAVEILSPSHTTFDASQKIVQAIMEAGGYLRFLESQLYLELVDPEKC